MFPVEVQSQESIQNFIDFYKQQINRQDNPKVIRIKGDGVVEFLYGSHGRTTFIIEPQSGTMTRVEKSDNQPWYWLNRLHKIYKTSNIWQLLADGIALLLILLLLSGLIVLRYTRQDFLLLIGGFLLILIGMMVA